MADQTDVTVWNAILTLLFFLSEIVGVSQCRYNGVFELIVGGVHGTFVCVVKEYLIQRPEAEEHHHEDRRSSVGVGTQTDSGLSEACETEAREAREARDPVR